MFVIEQFCPCPELDGPDLPPGTRPFCLEKSGGEVISTLRLADERAKESPVIRIGRVCNGLAGRGRSHTTRLMRAALEEFGSLRYRAGLR